MFGADISGLYALNFLKDNDINVDFVCDNYKSGVKWEDIPLIRVDELAKSDFECSIIITSGSYIWIIKQLELIGLARKIIGIITSQYFDNKELYRESDVLYRDTERIIGVYNLFTDNYSKAVFLNLIRFRLSHDYSYILSVADNPDKQYFDEELVKFSEKEIFIDVGAFNGDTIRSFLKRYNGNFEKIIAFEPDKASYKKLKEYMCLLSDDRISIRNAGLYNINARIGFDSEGLRSSLNCNSSNLIEAVRLDDCMNYQATFIKMDVEGAEVEALKGAKGIIQRWMPKLAICVYHNVTDLWEIPLLINNIAPGYNFYLRHYTRFGHETVLYAIKQR